MNFTTIKRINGDFPGRKGGWEGWEARFRHSKFLSVTDETLCGTESGPELADALLGTFSNPGYPSVGIQGLCHISLYYAPR